MGRDGDGVVAAYGEIGMRVSWSFIIRDRNQLAYDDDAAFLSRLPDDVAAHFRAEVAASQAPVRDYMAFFEGDGALAGARSRRCPAAARSGRLHWCSDPCLEAIFDTARRNGAKVHMHLVETERQADFARRRTGRSAIGHLAHLGCLGPDLTLGHGIWVDGEDLDLLAEHRCQVCHNASSGLRLASGIAPVTEMTRRGIKVGLGIDQSNIDDTRDADRDGPRLGAASGRRPVEPSPSPAAVLKMATEHGAATTGFAGSIGRLAPGQGADIVPFDWPAVARPYWIRVRGLSMRSSCGRGKKRSTPSMSAAGRWSRRRRDLDRPRRRAGEIGLLLAAPPSPAEAKARAMVDRLVPVMEGWFRRMRNILPQGPIATTRLENRDRSRTRRCEEGNVDRPDPSRTGPAGVAEPCPPRGRRAPSRCGRHGAAASRPQGARRRLAGSCLSVVTLIAPTALPSRPKIPAAMQRMPSLSSASSSR